MSARRLGVWPTQSPEWHAARTTRIGGSEIAAVCGWNPFESRDDLLQRKAGLLEARKSSKATDRGQRLEAAVIDWLCVRHKLALDPQFVGTWVHDEHDRYLYNPDGVATKGVLLEAKTTADRSEERGWGRAGTELVPLQYQAQAVWGMGVLGLERCYLGVLHGATNGRPDLGFATYTIDFNPDIWRHMCRRADQFLADLDQLTEGAAA